ncbi:hypothetical protein D3C71_1764900 [compost metagenome]
MPINSDAATTPRILPSPPRMTTMKQSMMVLVAMPSSIGNSGAEMAPARPASAAPTPNTALRMVAAGNPRMRTISPSLLAARTSMPKVLFSSTKKSTTETSRPKAMTNSR